MAKLKVAVLISGRGSNLQSLIDAAADPGYPAEIVLAISNVPGALGLERAAKAGIKTAVINHKDFNDRQAFDDALHARLLEAKAELICLAGFMRALTEKLVEKWRDRIINVHPSLLPAFKGLDAQEQAIRAGVRFSGCTVHFVRPAMDDGPIIAQACVPVMEDDDASALAARILAEEHKIYPLAVRLIAEGRVRAAGGRVIITGAAATSAKAMRNPEI